MLTDQIVIVRLVVALVLGGIIGLERELHGREAGFRTHILVTLGATLITMVSIYFSNIHGLAHADPSRIAAQIVTGIGFLGAGTIIRFGASVRGLTTAASLWAMASVGMAVGAGFYSAAIFTSVLVFSSLFLLTKIDRCLTRREVYRIAHVEVLPKTNILSDIRKTLDRYKAEIKNYNVRKKHSTGHMIFELNIKLSSSELSQLDIIAEEIANLENIVEIKWIT